jgi:hypothetical protein
MNAHSKQPLLVKLYGEVCSIRPDLSPKPRTVSIVLSQNGPGKSVLAARALALQRPKLPNRRKVGLNLRRAIGSEPAAEIHPSIHPQEAQSHGDMQPEIQPLAAEIHPSTHPQEAQSHGDMQPEIQPLAAADTVPGMLSLLRALCVLIAPETFATFRKVSNSSSLRVYPASLSSRAATRISRGSSCWSCRSCSSATCTPPIPNRRFLCLSNEERSSFLNVLYGDCPTTV